MARRDRGMLDVDAAIKSAYDDGLREGLRQGRGEILDWLQHAYLDDEGRPDRGTPKAQAILEIARDAARHFQKTVRR